MSVVPKPKKIKKVNLDINTNIKSRAPCGDREDVLMCLQVKEGQELHASNCKKLAIIL